MDHVRVYNLNSTQNRLNICAGEVERRVTANTTAQPEPDKDRAMCQPPGIERAPHKVL